MSNNYESDNTKHDAIADEDESVVILAASHKKGILRIIFSRFFIIALLLLLQIVVAGAALIFFARNMHFLYAIYAAFAIVMVLYLFNCSMDSSAKLTWMFIIAVLPVAGALFLAYTNSSLGHRKLKEFTLRSVRETMDELPQDQAVIDEIKSKDPQIPMIHSYVNHCGCFPIYKDNKVTYYPIGEKMFEAMLEELEKAKEFIFMEYFIVDEGYMTGRLLDILIRKAKEGVDVRFMYDGMCEISTLPRNYCELLEKNGIRAKHYAPLTPFVSTHYNYRDHRKIMSIDGKVAFTGGINLADEYINHIVRFGHWKDVGIKVEGSAARSFTLMFLQMWNLRNENRDYSAAHEGGDPAAATATEPAAEAADAARPAGVNTEDTTGENDGDNAEDPNGSAAGMSADGYIMPFCDNPLDSEKVAEGVYMSLLDDAVDYIYIMTPYMILDDELKTSLRNAAMRGADVKLILPGISDSKPAQALARTHYKNLMSAGVKIYEYTPGLVHAKVCVSDDTKAVVGTINFDYRSLYHHFECGALLFDAPCIADIKKDFEDTLSRSEEMDLQKLRSHKASLLAGVLLKPIAPLM